MNRRGFLLILGIFPKNGFSANSANKVSRKKAFKKALTIRRYLEKGGIYDNLPENWQEVEKAIEEGCEHFRPWISRMGRHERHGDIWWRVLPVKTEADETSLYFEKWGR